MSSSSHIPTQSQPSKKRRDRQRTLMKFMKRAFIQLGCDL